MYLQKINSYLLIQICKYFLLILFIFLAISWLLQITRLFSITNLMQINVINIIFLSLYLVPNILTIITPFILIFGLLICFIKLNNDRELIAILSLGLGVKPLIKSLILFTSFLVILFSVLNFYLAPKIYEKYKIQEFELRNNINFNSMSFSNFLYLDKDTILDFNKNKSTNNYEEIFINYQDEKDNIIYAKKGNIFQENNKFNFQLYDGFRISIDNNKQIEKLEFKNYKLKIDNTNIVKIEIIDKNTLTIFDDINTKNYLNITYKIFDLILIIYIVYFFYQNNLKNLNLTMKNNIFFLILCIFILICNQILKNSEILIASYTFSLISIIIFISILTSIKKYYE